MPSTRWIAQYGAVPVSTEIPYRVKRGTNPPVRYAAPLVDARYWGPHHVDLNLQAQLRRAFMRWESPDEQTAADLATVIRHGDEVVVWAHHEFGSFLAVLWLLDRMTGHGADPSRIRLVIDHKSPYERHTAEELAAAAEGALPFAEIADPLLRVRREIASDSDSVEIDRSGLPPEVADWAKLAERLQDLLPDSRGVDWFESRLLQQLGKKWRGGHLVISGAMMQYRRDFVFGDVLLWMRLLLMSDHASLLGRSYYLDSPLRLCEVRIDGDVLPGCAKARITRLGAEVRNGKADALENRETCRWVGGRLLTAERPLRHNGSHHEDALGNQPETCRL